MRIGFCVAQLLLNQLKHLAGALRIHMHLEGNSFPHSFPQLEQKSERNKTFNACQTCAACAVSFGWDGSRSLPCQSAWPVRSHLHSAPSRKSPDVWNRKNWQRVNQMISLVTYAFIFKRKIQVRVSDLSRVAFSWPLSLSMTGWIPNIKNSYLRWRRNSRLSCAYKAKQDLKNLYCFWQI